MKTMILTVLLLITGMAQANQVDTLDLDFGAPPVYGDPLNTNSRVGSIIYELSTNSFRGLYTNGNWSSISLPMTTQRLTASGTYTLPTSPRKPVYIKVKMIGGGGGGGGGGNVTPGGNGGDTTFSTASGTTFITAGGGGGSATTGVSVNGGVGGVVTVNSPAVALIAVRGSVGGNGSTGMVNGSGGNGGTGFFGGAGGGSTGGNVSTTAYAAANSGAGGGGGSTITATVAGNGGGSGGYIEASITNPDATYLFTIGAGGTRATGNPGTGYDGGNGGSGIIIVEEYYQ